MPNSAPQPVRDTATGRRMIHSLKARADANRTGPQRLADWMTDAFGSNWFLVANVIWFAVWSVWNANVIPGLKPFDPFPFGLLTMIVSLEAILLSIFVLIAQNRSARVDQLRQEIDLQVNMIAEDELTKLLCLVAKIAEKQGIDVAGDHELQQMLSPTNVEKIERVLQGQISHLKPGRADLAERSEASDPYSRAFREAIDVVGVAMEYGLPCATAWRARRARRRRRA